MEEIKNFYEIDGVDYCYRRWFKNSVARFDYRATQKSIKLFLKDRQFNSTLEVGCGPGTWTNILAEHSKKVIAVDISPKMIELARKNVKHKNVDFINKDIGKLDLLNERFDLIFSIRAFEYFDEQKEFIMNSYKILNENGELFIITKTKGSYWYGRSKVRNFFKKIFPFLFYYEKKELSLEQQKNLVNFKQNRMFVSEIKKYFRSAGFQNIKVRPVIVRPPVFMRGKSEIPIIPPLFERLAIWVLIPIDWFFSKIPIFTIFAESFKIEGTKK